MIFLRPVVDSKSFKANKPEPPKAKALPKTRKALQKVISSTVDIIVSYSFERESKKFTIFFSLTSP